MRVIKVFYRLLCRTAALAMIALLLFSGYVLWSNHRVYSDAKDVYDEILQIKPEEGEDCIPDFAYLKSINPDICAWITLTGTNIDYPIVRGESNLSYIDRDVYGEFSLAGSIFLDTRNNADFQDSYSLVYGHHMSNHLMFSDLDLYLEKEFFETNRSATLITETDIREMTVLAVLEIPDSSQEIFDPTMWGKDLTELALYIQEHALYIWDNAMTELLDNPITTQAIALATCSDRASGYRTVVILTAHREDENPDRPGGDTPAVTDNPLESPQTGNTDVLSLLAVLMLSSLIGMITIVCTFKRKVK